MAFKVKNQKGQAAIEMALMLPFLIWLLYYLINSYYTIHTSHIAQKYAAMNVWQRVNNRAKFIMDDERNALHNKEFIAVQYTDGEGNLPVRKIVRGPIRVDNKVGVCREPGCR